MPYNSMFGAEGPEIEQGNDSIHGNGQVLISGGTIGGGMLPKLNNCTSAVKNGVEKVHILDGRLPHSMLLEIFTNNGIGTAIVRGDK